jgi:hypothetical protein
MSEKKIVRNNILLPKPSICKNNNRLFNEN